MILEKIRTDQLLEKYKIAIFFLIILLSIFSIHYGAYCLQGSDFECFYEAGKGNFNFRTVNDAGWIYKDYLGIFFYPLTFFNLETAYIIYGGIGSICFLILSNLVMSKKYGWILVLSVLPLFKEMLQNSSTTLVFALLVCFPLPAIFSILFKPHFVVFPIIHTIKRGIKQSRDRTNIKAPKFDVDTSSILFDKKIIIDSLKNKKG